MSLVSRITLDGVADTTLGFEVLAGYDEPMLPDVRTRYVEIPGRAGRWEFSGDLASREIRLPCSVFSGSMAALATAARSIASALLDGDGKPKDVSLVFLKEATKTYTVRYSGAVPVERLVGSGLGNFTLSLVASDPYAYGAETTVTESVTVSPTEIEITNSGTVSTPVVITITNNGAGNVTGIKVAQKKVG